MLDALRVEVRHAQRDVRHPDAAPVRRDLVVGVEGVAQRPPGAVFHHEAEECTIRRDHAVELSDARRPQPDHDGELALERVEHLLALGRRDAHQRHFLEHDTVALILAHEDLALAAARERLVLDVVGLDLELLELIIFDLANKILFRLFLEPLRDPLLQALVALQSFAHGRIEVVELLTVALHGGRELFVARRAGLDGGQQLLVARSAGLDGGQQLLVARHARFHGSQHLGDLLAVTLLAVEHLLHLLVQVAEARFHLEPELAQLGRKLCRRHARVNRDRRDRDGVVREHRHHLALGLAGLADALGDELVDGRLDLVDALHALVVRRELIDVAEHVELRHDLLVEAA